MDPEKLSEEILQEANAVAAEREACARIADEAREFVLAQQGPVAADSVAVMIAVGIRARG